MVRLLKAAAEAEAACCEWIGGGSTVRARDGDEWCTEQGRAAPAPIISPSVTDSVSLKMPF